MRVFFYVSIVRIIGAPQSGPPRPLAAAYLLLFKHVRNDLTAPPQPCDPDACISAIQ